MNRICEASRLDQLEQGPLSHIREHPEVEADDINIILGLVSNRPRIVDIGAGRGGFVAAARRKGIDALALDIEPSAPAFWRKQAIPGLLASSPQLPFADASCHVVRLKEVIEHLPEPLSTVQSAATMLVPGGYLLAHVPSVYSQWYPVGNFWDDYTHVRPFSRRGLIRLIEDGGLTVVRIEGYVAGRNRLERILGRLLAIVLPHTYRVLAKRTGALVDA